MFMFKQNIKQTLSPVIEHSIEYDCRPFGNRTFDCVKLIKFYCEFSRLCSIAEPNRTIGVRLDSISERLIRYPRT